MDVDMNLIRKALEQADDALGTLRRGFGVDVTGHCYPARNTVDAALLHLRMVDLADAIDQTKDQIGIPRDSSLT